MITALFVLGLSGCAFRPSREVCVAAFVHSVAIVKNPRLQDLFESIRAQAKLTQVPPDVSGVEIEARRDGKTMHVVLSGDPSLENAEGFFVDLLWLPISYPALKYDVPKTILGEPNCDNHYTPGWQGGSFWVLNGGVLKETANTVTWFSPQTIVDPLYVCESSALPALPDIDAAHARIPTGFSSLDGKNYCRTTSDSETCVDFEPKAFLTSQYLQGLGVRLFRNAPTPVSLRDLAGLLNLFFSAPYISRVIDDLASTPLEPSDEWNMDSVLATGNFGLWRNRTETSFGITEQIWFFRRTDLPDWIYRRLTTNK